MNVTIVGLDLVKQYEDVSKNLNWPQSTRRETSNKELGTEKNDFRYSNMITDVYVTKCVLMAKVIFFSKLFSVSTYVTVVC